MANRPGAGGAREIVVYRPETEQEREYAAKQARDAGINAIENALERSGLPPNAKVHYKSLPDDIKDDIDCLLEALGIRDAIAENAAEAVAS